jgi:hypothetical protein
MKILLLILILTTSVQANIFEDAWDWTSGAYDTIDKFIDPCISSGNNKCWWETPSDGSGEVCRCDNGVI